MIEVAVYELNQGSILLEGVAIVEGGVRMTELELRNKVVEVMQDWLGWSEANGKFRAIIDLYNAQRPLPRGYRMGYSDEWCAATVTAAGIAVGLQDIILPECSCSRMLELYRARGQWVEEDSYHPRPGDIIMYDWQDSGRGDDTGAPDHVGVVEAVEGPTITVIEGNRGEAVARRTLQAGGRYIRGWCLPDYASKADKEDVMDYDTFKSFMDRYIAEQGSEPVDDWAVEAWEAAKKAGVLDGTRPHDPLTRQEAAVSLERLGLLD